jgi:hypothetical protein
LWLFAASGNKRNSPVLFVFFDTFVAIFCLREQATRQCSLFFSTLLWLFAASGNKRLANALCFFRHFCGYLLPKKPQKEAANFGSFFSQGFTTYYRTKIFKIIIVLLLLLLLLLIYIYI